MNKFQKLQEMVIAYKENGNQELTKEIWDMTARLLYQDRLAKETREDFREYGQNALVNLFTAGEGRQSQFERSLESYDPTKGLPFYSFFQSIFIKRIRDGFRRPSISTGQTSHQVQTVTFEDDNALVSSDQSSASKNIIHNILIEDLQKAILKALDTIDNEDYSNIVAFILFSDKTFKQQDLAEIFGLASGSINTYVSRGLQQFAQHFREAIKETFGIEDLSPEILLGAINMLKGNLPLGFRDDLQEKEHKLLNMRFLQGESRSRVCETMAISEEELISFEQEIVHDFLSKIQDLPRSVESGDFEGDTMNDIQEITAYLQKPLQHDVSRDAGGTIEPDLLYSLELFKHAFPNREQQTKARVKEKINSLSEAELSNLFDKLESSSMAIYNCVEEPERDPELYAKLTGALGVRVEQDEEILQTFLAKISEPKP